MIMIGFIGEGRTINCIPGGLFIVIEGIGGTGKTTVSGRLTQLLEQDGYETLTRQPGGTEVGCKLRPLLLNPAYAEDVDEVTQALLYAADRRIHLRHIRRALAEGKIIISDRYVYSNLAYQVAGGSDRSFIAQLDKYATEGLRPHQAFWLDLDPLAARERLTNDSRQEQDRFDADLAFQYKLHEVFAEQLHSCPELTRVDADRPAGEIVNDIYGQILALI